MTEDMGGLHSHLNYNTIRKKKKLHREKVKAPPHSDM
jgi:hypothetical protein